MKWSEQKNVTKDSRKSSTCKTGSHPFMIIQCLYLCFVETTRDSGTSFFVYPRIYLLSFFKSEICINTFGFSLLINNNFLGLMYKFI